MLSTNGDTYLGGDDFDQCNCKTLDRSERNKMKKNYNTHKSLAQELRLKAEEAKKHLSTNDNFTGEAGWRIRLN